MVGGLLGGKRWYEGLSGKARMARLGVGNGRGRGKNRDRNRDSDMKKSKYDGVFHILHRPGLGM